MHKYVSSEIQCNQMPSTIAMHVTINDLEQVAMINWCLQTNKIQIKNKPIALRERRDGVRFKNLLKRKGGERERGLLPLLLPVGGEVGTYHAPCGTYSCSLNNARSRASV